MDWILSNKLQVWFRVAQRDNHNRISAFEYSANTVDNTQDSTIEFVRKGQTGFRKLWNAYYKEQPCK